MANHASSKKRIRRNERRAQVNSTRRNRIRTYIKRVESAVADKDVKAAEEGYQVVQSEMQRGISKGLFQKQTVSRKLSRLSARIKAVKQGAA